MTSKITLNTKSKNQLKISLNKLEDLVNQDKFFGLAHGFFMENIKKVDEKIIDISSKNYISLVLTKYLGFDKRHESISHTSEFKLSGNKIYVVSQKENSTPTLEDSESINVLKQECELENGRYRLRFEDFSFEKIPLIEKINVLAAKNGFILFQTSLKDKHELQYFELNKGQRIVNNSQLNLILKTEKYLGKNHHIKSKYLERKHFLDHHIKRGNWQTVNEGIHYLKETPKFKEEDIQKAYLYNLEDCCQPWNSVRSGYKLTKIKPVLSEDKIQEVYASNFSHENIKDALIGYELTGKKVNPKNYDVNKIQETYEYYAKQMNTQSWNIISKLIKMTGLLPESEDFYYYINKQFSWIPESKKELKDKYLQDFELNTNINLKKYKNQS